MKRLLIALLLLSSPVVAQEYTIYTSERPPYSSSGTIDLNNRYYFFTNDATAKCDLTLVAHSKYKFFRDRYGNEWNEYNGRYGKWCFIRTNQKAKIISKDVIKVLNSYYCSERHIQKVIQANRKSKGHHFYGKGDCTKDGWVPWPTNLTQ